jgi:hypothetical protein
MDGRRLTTAVVPKLSCRGWSQRRWRWQLPNFPAAEVVDDGGGDDERRRERERERERLGVGEREESEGRRKTWN